MFGHAILTGRELINKGIHSMLIIIEKRNRDC